MSWILFSPSYRNSTRTTRGSSRAGHPTQNFSETSIFLNSAPCLHPYPFRVQMRRRNSSISSGLARLSMSQISASQPSQPQSPEAHVSVFPEQFSHEPQHYCTRSPKAPLPDHHNPSSQTQRRGSSITRNPISDTWREEAYKRKEAGKEKIVDVAKKQDRWRCEYCENLNERGIVKDEHEADKTKDSHDAGSGVTSSSKL